MPEAFDAIVIGTGQAGPPLAVRLAGAGRRVAIVERRRFGGTCVNVGCIPTKTLVASARTAFVARQAAKYGVVIDGPLHVDLARVKARKDAVVAESTRGVEAWLRGTANVEVVQGHAQFTAPHSVRVGDRVLTAPLVFVNTGGRASVPPLAGLSAVPSLTSTGILDLDTLPEHLIIVGGSYIGLEFAQMYRRFGSRVTVVELAPRVLAREDDEISAAVQALLEHEGVEVRTGAQCLAVEAHASGVAVRVDCAREPRVIVGSHLLLAVGRVPNTDDLGLANAGVAVDPHGYIVVDDQLATNVPGIYALGDVNGRGGFTHTAYNDYEIVAANLLDGMQRRLSDRVPVYALFTDPPLARAGMGVREARASGRPILVGRREMTRVGRARERGETTGFMQVLVDAETRRILGATLFGIEADEAIHCVIDAMSANLPYTAVQRAMHIHPTVAELIPTLLGELMPLPSP